MQRHTVYRYTENFSKIEEAVALEATVTLNLKLSFYNLLKSWPPEQGLEPWTVRLKA